MTDRDTTVPDRASIDATPGPRAVTVTTLGVAGSKETSTTLSSVDNHRIFDVMRGFPLVS
jgi:hypothetical protein